MAEVPKKVIEPDLFDLLDDYVHLLDCGEAIVDDVVPATSSLILFTQNAFAQFFENELDVAIEGFDDRAKKKAIAAKRKCGPGSPQRLIISVFLNFCEEYDDVKSASYVGQGEEEDPRGPRLANPGADRVAADRGPGCRRPIG